MGTTAQKLNRVLQTKSDLKTVINYSGANITNETTFKDYPKLLNKAYIDILNDEGESLYTALPKTTGTGTSIDLNTEKGKMKIELNSSDLTQSGTPSTDNPVDVNIITGDNNIKITDGTEEQNYPITLSSKNLFNPSYYLNQTFLTSVYKYTLSDVVGNRNLYFKGKLKEGKEKINGLFVSLTTSGGDPNQGTSCYAIRGGNPSSSQYITADFTGINDLYLSFYPAAYRWEQINEVYDFWIATEDIEYSPYIANPIEYCKIGDYQDYIFRNDNKWYKHNAIGKVVLDDSYGWTRETNASWICPRFTCTTLPNLGTTVNNTTFKNTFSNYSKYNGTSYTATKNSHLLRYVNNTNRIDCMFDLASVEELKALLAVTPMVIYYPLITPTETQITDTNLIQQLDNLKNAKSYDDVTHIMQTNTDLSFNLEVSALAKIE